MQCSDSLSKEITLKSTSVFKNIKELITSIRATSRSAMKKTTLMKNVKVTFKITKELLTFVKIWCLIQKKHLKSEIFKTVTSQTMQRIWQQKKHIQWQRFWNFHTVLTIKNLKQHIIKMQVKKQIQQKNYTQLFCNLCEQKNEQIIFNDDDDWISIFNDAEIFKSAVIYNSELAC